MILSFPHLNRWKSGLETGKMSKTKEKKALIKTKNRKMKQNNLKFDPRKAPNMKKKQKKTITQHNK